jgi:hypothetical protein
VTLSGGGAGLGIGVGLAVASASDESAAVESFLQQFLQGCRDVLRWSVEVDDQDEDGQ